MRSVARTVVERASENRYARRRGVYRRNTSVLLAQMLLPHQRHRAAGPEERAVVGVMAQLALTAKQQQEWLDL